MRIHALSCAVLLLGSLATGQQSPATVVTGTATTDVYAMPSFMHAVVASPSGVMWALVRAVDTNGSSLYLTASTDGGRTWTGRFDTSTQVDGYGAICADRDCGLLDVAWHAKDTGTYYNVYYQAFDTQTLTWVGQPQQLVTGVSSNDQTSVTDIGVSERGAIAIALGSNRSPASPWVSGWAGGLLVRPAGSTTWNTLVQVNVDYTGVYMNMCIVGEVVHMTYRSNTGGYGIRYRAFDLTTNTFTTAQGIQLDSLTSNVAQIASDANGGLYILYAKGSSSGPGGGELRIAYAAPGNYTQWTSQLVFADSDMIHGNIAYYHYSLASTDSGQVAAFYSKLTNENLSNLYMRIYSGGMASTPELQLWQTTDSDRFARVDAVRNPGTAIPPTCLVESTATVHVGHRLDFLAVAPTNRSVRYGIGCGGSSSQAPDLHTTGWPGSAPTMTLDLSNAPASQAGTLLYGLACQPPIDLSRIGMPGCRLDVLVSGAAGIATDPSGAFSLTFHPPTPVTFAGTPIHFQTAVLAPGANPLGILASNAVSVVFE